MLSRGVADALDAAEPEHDRAIQLAALLGRVVATSEWAAVCADAQISPPDAVVDQLARQGLIRVDEGALAFTHELLRETVAKRATETGRHLEDHARCARVVAALYPSGYPDRAERVGEHLLAAGQTEAALGPLLEAAHERFNRTEYAATHALLTRRDDAIAGLGLGHDDPRWRAGAARRMTTCLMEGQALRGLEVAEEVLDSGSELQDATTGEALLTLGFVHCHHLQQPQEGIAYQRRSVEVYEALGDHSSAGRGVFTQAGPWLRTGNLPRAQEATEEAMRHFEACGDTRGVMAVWLMRGMIQMAAGDPVQARAYFLNVPPLCAGGQHPFDEARVQVNLGNAAITLGEVSAARAHYRECLRRSEALGIAWQALEARVGLVRCDLEEGLFEEARSILGPLRRAAEEERHIYVAMSSGLAAVAVAAGRRAWGAWDDAWAAYRAKREASPYMEKVVANLAETAARLAREAGDEARAAAADAEVAEWEQRLRR